MKQVGGVTYIGVSLKDLNKYFKEDAVIHISKKFLKSSLIGIKRDLYKLGNIRECVEAQPETRN
jgi:hypothetical protein